MVRSTPVLYLVTIIHVVFMPTSLLPAKQQQT
jgi:hypothetical protein